MSIFLLGVVSCAESGSPGHPVLPVAPEATESSITPDPGRDQLVRLPYTSQLDQSRREFLVYLPVGYAEDPEKNWPLMLFLHGDGERGDGLKELNFVMAHGPLYEAWIQRKKIPFIIIAPQLHMFDFRENGPDFIRNRSMDSLPIRLQQGVPDRDEFFETNRRMAGAVPADMSSMPVTYDHGWSQVEQDLIAMLNTVEATFRTDEQRTYLTGLSSGGMGTWFLASKHPQRFAAIAPVVGFGHPDLMEPIATNRTPVWAFAGGRDETVEAKYFYEAINRLEELGHEDVRFTVHEDMGHDVWRRVYGGDDIYTWLLSHQLGD
jgi:predicted peptidase